eukprot:CAMPEP_0195528046 /NCGR_PEP_ID=MMETSP0794_2-20130614/30018_1 /TAXON_ID=515487 /ORGANISM="Stephanopyxis turris, Strain CCMP 815" /LENGTH=341 /DNA_ID=CAMNT_0040659093 /DNA_START=153 /DNA_END=1178 /DNA_ORIENTATION=+
MSDKIGLINKLKQQLAARNKSSSDDKDDPDKCLSSCWERENDPLSFLRYSSGVYRIPVKKIGSVLREEENDDVREEMIEIRENMSHIGTRVWDTAVFMVKYFEKNLNDDTRACSTLLQSKNRSNPTHSNNSNPPGTPETGALRVLELGAGTGLLSIALAKMLNASVLATEYGPAIMSNMIYNCKINGVLNDSPEYNGSEHAEDCPAILVSPPLEYENIDNTEMITAPGSVTCRELDWYSCSASKEGDLENALTSSFAPFHMIVASDCMLTPSDSAALVSVIKGYATCGVTMIYVGACRERSGFQHFMSLAAEEFSFCSIIEPSAYYEGYSSNRLIIVKLSL